MEYELIEKVNALLIEIKNALKTIDELQRSTSITDEERLQGLNSIKGDFISTVDSLERNLNQSYEKLRKIHEYLSNI